MKKKAISILLTAAMAMSAVPAYAEATTEGAGAATGAATTPQAPDWTEYNQLIQEIYTDTDLDDREARMHQAEDMLMDTGAVVPLYYLCFGLWKQNYPLVLTAALFFAIHTINGYMNFIAKK